MKIINDTLYICMPDMVACGFDEQRLYEYVSKGYTTLPSIKENGKLLFDFANLGDRYKEAIVKKFGDPYEYMAIEPIRRMLTKDLKAEAFFYSYAYNGPDGQGTKLPTTATNNVVAKYTHEASWLNLLNYCDENKKEVIKKTLNLSVVKFFENAIKLISLDVQAGRVTGKFPTSYQRLLKKMKAYKDQGYQSLIHPSFGNKSAAKIDDDVAEDKLKEIIEHPYQYDDLIICHLYNRWAVENNYKPVGPATVGNKRRLWEPELMASREGWSAYNEKYLRQVKGLPAHTMHPLALVESDDYNLNYYFIDPTMKGDSKNMQRFVSYVVVDSSLDLVLGYSYRQAKAPVFEMVQLAYLDAMYYIKSLVNDGNWYLPFEVKADHWQQSMAFPYFNNISHFVKPAVGNKHRGYIEQFFGSPHAKRAEKIAAHEAMNYNGNNITARHRGVNLEAMQANAKRRPLIGNGAEEQVEKFFYLLRNMAAITRNNMQAASKQTQWLERWKALPESQKRPITDIQFLQKFGITHAPQGRGISISNRGVEPVIGGIKYSYDLPDHAGMQQLIGTEVNVVYDPYDMSRVLITDGDRIRFIAKEATLQPRALVYQYGGSRTALNTILAEKKKQVAQVSELAASRKYDAIDIEAVMLGGIMPKELLASAEQGYRETTDQHPGEDWAALRAEYLESQNNFDDYVK